jgi:hypothetical protein
MNKMLGWAIFAATAAFAAADPALAGTIATPGPALGAGLPALAAIGAGYWLVRRYRRS